MLAAAVILSSQLGNSDAKEAARGVQMKCQEKYCPPNFQVQVDRALNTLSRDDSLGTGLRLGIERPTLNDLYNYTKGMYYREAHEHPGVRLVAHTVS